jgi:hypothetical protein
MIRSLLDEFSLVFMCRMLQVSSSGYYQWRRQKPSARAQSNTLRGWQANSKTPAGDGVYQPNAGE